MPDEGIGADPYANKQVWLETVKTAQEAGLDHTLPRRKARTKGEAALRDEMKLALSRKTFSMPDLSHIRWNRSTHAG